MKWARYVARMRAKIIQSFCKKIEGNIRLENLAVNERISKLILQNYNGKFWTGLIWYVIGTSGGLL
jgi:hypothetical protein